MTAQSSPVRKLKAVVISDAHLGTYGSKASQLYAYLRSIKPEILVLNGDIIDAWRFSRKYFPTDHLKVLRHLIKMIESGTRLIYIPGNHDEVARRFAGIEFNNFKVENKIVLTLDGTTTWIFHGDVFDVVLHHSKWLAKMGSMGYGILTAINKIVNSILRFFGKNKISLAGKIKDKVKGGSKDTVSNFESTVARLAIRKGYDYAICGHIHRPVKKRILTPRGAVTYINSGDWVDNMTALEYEDKDWHLRYWDKEMYDVVDDNTVEEILSETTEDIFIKAFKEIIKS
ncbi:UDP-2,3-diacylglucosamine diphosphatase [Marinilabiliaceae bacterium ANBcel2]|nr:UDP-2,3-diacylglucosamine diphosphatase [Marinilabiliaceae bacterium ANBcel2]